MVFITQHSVQEKTLTNPQFIVHIWGPVTTVQEETMKSLTLGIFSMENGEEAQTQGLPQGCQ